MKVEHGGKKLVHVLLVGVVLQAEFGAKSTLDPYPLLRPVGRPPRSVNMKALMGSWKFVEVNHLLKSLDCQSAGESNRVDGKKNHSPSSVREGFAEQSIWLRLARFLTYRQSVDDAVVLSQLIGAGTTDLKQLTDDSAKLLSKRACYRCAKL